MKIELECDWCGKSIKKYECKITKHNFCSRHCLAAFSNKSKNPNRYSELKDLSAASGHMTQLNAKLNPTRMTKETRKKVREARLNTGTGKGYTKLYGKAAHRVVAEKILGRELKSGEVVHHIDFNPRNNNPDNLMIFPSQAEHARYHNKLNRFFYTGELDGSEICEVVFNDI